MLQLPVASSFFKSVNYFTLCCINVTQHINQYVWDRMDIVYWFRINFILLNILCNRWQRKSELCKSIARKLDFEIIQFMYFRNITAFPPCLMDRDCGGGKFGVRWNLQSEQIKHIFSLSSSFVVSCLFHFTGITFLIQFLFKIKSCTKNILLFYPL